MSADPRPPAAADRGPASPAGPSGAHSWEWQTHGYGMLHVRLELILGEILARRPRSLLELGCGVGVLRAELARRAPQVRYYGCDVSRSAVALAADPDVVQADLNAGPVPFDSLRFDCIAGSGILEYIRDLPALFREVRGRLEEGGAFVLSYFNMNHLYRRAQRLARKTPYRNPGWVNAFGYGELRGLLREAGFRVRHEIPTNLGLGPSPSIGRERWRASTLRRVRRLPFVPLFAHQLVFACTA